MGNIKSGNVVIYGNGVWEKYFVNLWNVFIKYFVNMDDVIKIMRRFKMMLNCIILFIYNGSYERFLMVVMVGSLVVFNYFLFFELVFGDGVFMINFLEINSLDERIYEILNNDNLRIEMV